MKIILKNYMNNPYQFSFRVHIILLYKYITTNFQNNEHNINIYNK